jgi:hypothetical protein
MTRTTEPGRVAGTIGPQPDRQSPGMSHVIPGTETGSGTVYEVPGAAPWVVPADTVGERCQRCGRAAVLALPADLRALQPDGTTHVCHPGLGGCNHGFAADVFLAVLGPQASTVEPVPVTGTATVLEPVTPRWVFYGLAEQDQGAEVITGQRIWTGKPTGTYRTEDGRHWREAAPDEVAAAVRPRKGNDGPGTREHGRYTRLALVGAPVETLTAATPTTTDQGDPMGATATATKPGKGSKSTKSTTKPATTKAAKAEKPARVLPTERGLDLKGLGNVTDATAYLVQTEGTALTREAMRARLEAAFGTGATKGYRPGMVAAALKAAGVTPAKSVKAAPAAASAPKGEGAAPTPAPTAKGPETGTQAAKGGAKKGAKAAATAPATRAVPKPGAAKAGKKGGKATK